MSKKTNKNYIISKDLANNILRYLSEKPYKEVFDFIRQLGELTPIEEEENDESDRQ